MISDMEQEQAVELEHSESNLTRKSPCKDYYMREKLSHWLEFSQIMSSSVGGCHY